MTYSNLRPPVEPHRVPDWWRDLTSGRYCPQKHGTARMLFAGKLIFRDPPAVVLESDPAIVLGVIGWIQDECFFVGEKDHGPGAGGLLLSSSGLLLATFSGN